MELKKVVGEPFQGHKNLDSSMACSFLRDGTRATLCSGDKSVRVCDVKTGKTITGPFRGYSQLEWYDMKSVLLSHDNKHIPSCSSNEMIQIWDSEVGESV